VTLSSPEPKKKMIKETQDTHNKMGGIDIFWVSSKYLDKHFFFERNKRNGRWMFNFSFENKICLFFDIFSGLFCQVAMISRDILNSLRPAYLFQREK
jgi:hypothetical protein